MLKDQGYQFWKPGDDLAALIIVDGRGDGCSHEHLYNPNANDIARVCETYGIPSEPLMEMIHNQLSSYSHTLFLDVEKYLESLKPAVPHTLKEG